MNRPPEAYGLENSPYSVSPLPDVLKHGLAAVVVFGFLSFLTSVALFVFLIYKLTNWQFRSRQTLFQLPSAVLRRPPRPSSSASRADNTRPETPHLPPFDLATSKISPEHLCPQKDVESGTSVAYQSGPATAPTSVWQHIRRHPPNQFLVLIINLLFADIQQALAFLLNVAWLTKDGVHVGTKTCWAQGWFVSTGDLASSVFITAIAAHTYLGVVWCYRLPSWAFYLVIAAGWAFVYGTAILGVIITNDGRGAGGLYVRAGAWCWINTEYQDLRLYLHYLWIFIGLGLTTFLYILVFLHIRSITRRGGRLPDAIMLDSRRNPSRTNVTAPKLDQPPPVPYLAPFATESATETKTPLSADATGPGEPEPPVQQPPSPTRLPNSPPPQAQQPERSPSRFGQHTFLLYPLIYVVCTTPLAAGRIATMAGNNVGLVYFCFAAAAIACNGWLDVLLYASTRRSIVFAGEAPPSEDTGIDTFSFMRTPRGREFGNVVFVSGGVDPELGTVKHYSRPSGGSVVGGPRLPGTSSGLRSPKKWGGIWNGTESRNVSQESLRGFASGGADGAGMGLAIQCETVTTVVVEVDQRNSRRNPSLASSVDVTQL